MNYTIGAKIRLMATFTNASDDLADPATVSLSLRAPDGTLSTYTYAGGQLTKSGTGVYYMDFTIPSVASSVGSWDVRAAGTGVVAGAEESSFNVRESSFF